MSELSLIEHKSYIGQDFLTWLLAMSEIRGGEMHVPKCGKFDLIFDQKVIMTSAAEKVAWTGEITSIDQIRAAIRTGKKVLEAQFRLTAGPKEWRFNLNTRTFQFKGVKTPKILAREDTEILYDKLDVLDELIGFIDELFSEFVRRRLDRQSWEAEVDAIRNWLNWT